jgi:hypothetical protein
VDVSRDETDLNILDSHYQSYVGAMARQHEYALESLTQQPPDFSSAATACHRALQFQRQADALRELRRQMIS